MWRRFYENPTLNLMYVTLFLLHFSAATNLFRILYPVLRSFCFHIDCRFSVFSYPRVSTLGSECLCFLIQNLELAYGLLKTETLLNLDDFNYTQSLGSLIVFGF